MIPTEQSRITVEDELIGARPWSERHDIKLNWLANGLELRVELVQPQTNEVFFLRGRFSDYKAVAPEWAFASKEWSGDGQLAYFPNPVQSSHGPSIFINHGNRGVICVPFNRLAYATHAGPHQDWGAPANWLSAAPAYVHAETVGDMLQVIFRDLSYTKGQAGR